MGGKRAYASKNIAMTLPSSNIDRHDVGSCTVPASSTDSSIIVPIKSYERQFLMSCMQFSRRRECETSPCEISERRILSPTWNTPWSWRSRNWLDARR